MGVSKLTKYTEEFCKGVFTDVNIAQAAEIFRNQNNREPVLVVDAPNVARGIFKNKVQLCGGQWNEYLQEWRTFVTNVKDAGIKLVFFFDGGICDSKLKEWIKRRMEKMRTIENLFTGLFNGVSSDNTIFPASMSYYTRYLLKFELNCECIASQSECDWEIAKYAKEKRCFAILAHDSDYIIYNAAKHYFSSQHLNISTLNTKQYNIDRLARNLRLNLSHLPLLACLLGNDYIDIKELYEFHKELSQKHHPAVLVPAVSRYISRILTQQDVHSHIAKHVFRNHRMADKLRHIEAQYKLLSMGELFVQKKRCILSSDLQSEAEKRYLSCDYDGYIYISLCQGELHYGEDLEDIRCGLPPCNLAFRKIRKRLYYLLGLTQVTEYCVQPSFPVNEPSIVSAEPLPGNVMLSNSQVELHRFWVTKNDEDIKWTLFCQCIGTGIDVVLLRSLPLRYVGLCSVLHYLINDDESHRLEYFEIDALIFTAMKVAEMGYEASNDINVGVSIDPRAVNLASLYLNGLQAMLMVIGVLNGPVSPNDLMPWKVFDGNLFMNTYQAVKGGDSIEFSKYQDSSLFNQIKSFLSVRKYIQA